VIIKPFFIDENLDESFGEESIDINRFAFMLILFSLTALNELITDFGAPCPNCYKCDYKIYASKQIGMGQLLIIKYECGYKFQGYSMPENSNYSFCHAILSNEFSITKLQDFFRMMNLNIDLID
jgi:hypothetical protein